jgi:Rrf2 family protein
MQLTRAADYAVRMMIHLATLPNGSRTNRAALAAASSVPEPFVGKILQTLTKSGLIESQRGMNGGFALAASPEEVSILNIVEAVEGPTALNTCVKPGATCDRKAWCPAHPVWCEAQDAMTAVLRRATLASLARTRIKDQEPQWISL